MAQQRKRSYLGWIGLAMIIMGAWVGNLEIHGAGGRGDGSAGGMVELLGFFLIGVAIMRKIFRMLFSSSAQ